MEPSVDLVILFKTQTGPSLNKQHARDEAAQAQEQYSRLLSVLTAGGLKAAGRSGKDQSQLLVFIQCSESQLSRLVHRERYVTNVSFVSIFPVFTLGSVDTQILSSASRRQRCQMRRTPSICHPSLLQNAFASFTRTSQLLPQTADLVSRLMRRAGHASSPSWPCTTPNSMKPGSSLCRRRDLYAGNTLTLSVAR